MQIQDLVGTLGLPINLAAGIWLVYGGARLWQTLRGRDNGYGKLTDKLDELQKSIVGALNTNSSRLESSLENSQRNAQLLLQSNMELIIGRAKGSIMAGIGQTKGELISKVDGMKSDLLLEIRTSRSKA